MPSPQFHTVSQNDDYRLDDFPQAPLQYSRHTLDAMESSKAPGRWKSLKSAYSPQATYITIPDAYVNHDAKKRPNANDRRRSSRLSLRQLANPVSNFRIPTFAAPWQHGKPELSHSSQVSTVRTFNQRNQRQRVFVNGILQWLVTVGIVLCQFAALYGFSQPHTLSRGEKYTFNAITTLLSLCLGMAIVTALRSYAKLLSWRFLASGYRDLQDFELIMNCDSQSKVLKLLVSGRTPGRFWVNKTQLLCLVSITLVIGLQIAIGLLGLCYDIDTSNYLKLTLGTVSLADLSNVYQDPAFNVTGIGDQTGASNYYGLVGQSYGISYTRVGEGNSGLETIYTADNITFFYQYIEQSVLKHSATTTPSIATSTRYVTADANCVQLEIMSGGYVTAESSQSFLDYRDEYGIEQSIFVDGNTVATSTYMSNSSSNCGNRCTSILILDTGRMPAENAVESDGVQIKPQLFACNSTVSEVKNIESCSYPANCTLSDESAKYLAGSIGWTGKLYPKGNPLQYHTYPPGSPWSWDGTQDSEYQNAEFRAQQVAMFTADGLAAMDDAGPRITMDDMWAPRPAVALNVKWKYAAPVLCVVPGVQLIVLMVVCIFASGALIKDGGYLSAARLLRPVVEKLEEHG